ncbi:MAG: glutaredoxin family protein [bacterium]
MLWRKNKPIEIKLYKWAGQWGPFKVKIPCGECALTEDVIADTIANELADIKVKFIQKDWLSYWWEPLLAAGWHAPIVMVDGKVIAQGDALNRGVLTERVVRAYAKRFAIEGSHFFGKPNCRHCVRGKNYLEEAGIDYVYHDVIANPAAMYEMLARVKPIIGEATPITTPQIFLEGTYIGGADELGEILGRDIEADRRRGQGSLSPSRKAVS